MSDQHDGAASFTDAGSGARGPQIPPDDGALRLVLVRHGRTPSNVVHALDTALPGPSLDELGRTQAKEVGVLLAGWPVRAVHTSRATRARETAGPIARAHDMTADELPGLHEVFVGDLEMRTDDEARAIFDDVFDAWWNGAPERAMPGGESARDLWNRALPDLGAVTGGIGSGAVVVVSHGAAIRILTRVLLDGRADMSFGRENPIPNTGRVVLRRDPDGWTRELWDPMPGGRRSPH